MANELAKVEDAAGAIDAIVKECGPIAARGAEHFLETLALADGITRMRDLFLNHPQIKSTIENMRDTRLGFMTDRTPEIIAASAARKKTIAHFASSEG